MKIKLRSTYAGPRGVFYAGGEIDVPVSEANDLIAGGYADPVKVPVVIETAAIEPDESPEPVTPRPRRRSR